MPEDKKADLEQRIEEYRHKIEEISAFRDDPKIEKIIKALQKQIAQDSYQLSVLDQVPEFLLNPLSQFSAFSLHGCPGTGGSQSGI